MSSVSFVLAFCFKLHAASFVGQKWKEILILVNLLLDLQKGR